MTIFGSLIKISQYKFVMKRELGRRVLIPSAKSLYQMRTILVLSHLRNAISKSERWISMHMCVLFDKMALMETSNAWLPQKLKKITQMLQKSLKTSFQKKEFSTSSIRSRNKLLQFNSIRQQTSKRMSLIVTIQMRTSIVLKLRMTKALTLHQTWERMTQKCSKLFQTAQCQKESRFHALIPAISRLYRMMTSLQKRLRFNKSGSTI